MMTSAPAGGARHAHAMGRVIEGALAPVLAHKDRAGRTIEGADLFGPNMVAAGAGVSPAGRPRLPLRPTVSLLYLKHERVAL